MHEKNHTRHSVCIFRIFPNDSQVQSFAPNCTEIDNPRAGEFGRIIAESVASAINLYVGQSMPSINSKFMASKLLVFHDKNQACYEVYTHDSNGSIDSKTEELLYHIILNYLDKIIGYTDLLEAPPKIDIDLSLFDGHVSEFLGKYESRNIGSGYHVNRTMDEKPRPIMGAVRKNNSESKLKDTHYDVIHAAFDGGSEKDKTMLVYLVDGTLTSNNQRVLVWHCKSIYIAAMTLYMQGKFLKLTVKTTYTWKGGKQTKEETITKVEELKNDGFKLTAN